MHQRPGGTGVFLLKGVFLTTLMLLLGAAAAQAQTPDFAAVLHDKGLPFAFGLAFAGGFLLSLTPCVYPMNSCRPRHF